ncbi:hypothetical protein NUITMVA1_23850 [Aeromonas hydrophila]|nr:hypothetical protein NUITMVA1_23850 [Aeromonas hydrophila]
MYKTQSGDLAGRIVHKHDGGTGWRPIFKPAMITAVNLDKLTKAGSPVARLLDPGGTLPTRYPQSQIDHQLANCADGKVDAM